MSVCIRITSILHSFGVCTVVRELFVEVVLGVVTLPSTRRVSYQKLIQTSKKVMHEYSLG